MKGEEGPADEVLCKECAELGEEGGVELVEGEVRADQGVAVEG